VTGSKQRTSRQLSSQTTGNTLLSLRLGILQNNNTACPADLGSAARWRYLVAKLVTTAPHLNALIAGSQFD